MASLTDAQKLFVVQQLGYHYSVGDVCEQLKEEFGITAKTNQIARYKVGCAPAETLSPELIEAFIAAREGFDLNVEIVPIMNRTYRARELQAIFERTKKTSPLVAAKILEQAAREAGGHYRRTVEPNEDWDAETIEKNERIVAIVRRARLRERNAEVVSPGEPGAAA